MSGPLGAWIEGFRDRRVLAVGPHPDDLAFSVGGLLRELAGLAQVTVVTIFTRSVWAPNLDIGERVTDRVTRLRQAEDVLYCATLGVARVALDLDDAGLRGYDVRAERRGLRVDDPAPGAVRRGLLGLVRDADVLLCPLGLGSHVDHEVARDALRETRPSRGLKTCFYEDLPYARRFPASRIEAHVRRMDPRARAYRFDLSPSWERKVAGIAVYGTQVRAQDLDDVRRHAVKAAGGGGLAERLWLAPA